MHFRVEGSDPRTGAVSVRIIEAVDEIDACQRAAAVPFFRMIRAIPLRRSPIWERSPGSAAPAPDPATALAPAAAAPVSPEVSSWDMPTAVEEPDPDAGPPEMEVPTRPWTDRARSAENPVLAPAPATPARPRYEWTQTPAAAGEPDLPEGAVPDGARTAVTVLGVVNLLTVAALIALRAVPTAVDSPLVVTSFAIAANLPGLVGTAVAVAAHARHRCYATQRLVARAAVIALVGIFTLSFSTAMGWLTPDAPPEPAVTAT